MYNYFQEQYWKLAVFKSPGMTQITERIPMGIFGQKKKNNLYFATYNLLSPVQHSTLIIKQTYKIERY